MKPSFDFISKLTVRSKRTERVHLCTSWVSGKAWAISIPFPCENENNIYCLKLLHSFSFIQQKACVFRSRIACASCKCLRICVRWTCSAVVRNTEYFILFISNWFNWRCDVHNTCSKIKSIWCVLASVAACRHIHLSNKCDSNVRPMNASIHSSINLSN